MKVMRMDEGDAGCWGRFPVLTGRPRLIARTISFIPALSLIRLENAAITTLRRCAEDPNAADPAD
jgi:hypothetical protein